MRLLPVQVVPLLESSSVTELSSGVDSSWLSDTHV